MALAQVERVRTLLSETATPARRHAAGLPTALPDEVALVPVLAECTGLELNEAIHTCLDRLARDGSVLVPGASAAGVLARSDADPRFIIESAVADP